MASFEGGPPKPVIKLADGETLIHKTYSRAKTLGSAVLTVTNRDYYFISRDEQVRAGVSGGFLLEPIGRNTAPAIALAAKFVAENHGPEAIMLILAADHLIADQAEFAVAVSDAARLAEQNYLVTFGIVPTTPAIGFGYIEQGERLEIGNKVVRFVEKPNLQAAQRYVASGKYLWNSGMFCFKAGIFLEELSKTAADIAEGIDACWLAMQPVSFDVSEIPIALFKNVPDISFDYAVMERSEKVAVVPGKFGWSDIESWNAMQDLVSPDPNGNRALGETILIDTQNTFVQS